MKTKIGLVIANILLISLGALITWNNLWQHNPMYVEWYFLGYNPTYRINNKLLAGVYTLDFFQVFSLIAIFLDLYYLVQTHLSRKLLK